MRFFIPLENFIRLFIWGAAESIVLVLFNFDNSVYLGAVSTYELFSFLIDWPKVFGEEKGALFSGELAWT